MSEIFEQPWSSPDVIRIEAALGMFASHGLLDDYVHTPGIIHPPTLHVACEIIQIRDKGRVPLLIQRPANTILRASSKEIGSLVVNLDNESPLLEEELANIEQMTSLIRGALLKVRGRGTEISLRYQ